MGMAIDNIPLRTALQLTSTSLSLSTQ